MTMRFRLTAVALCVLALFAGADEPEGPPPEATCTLAGAEVECAAAHYRAGRSPAHLAGNASGCARSDPQAWPPRPQACEPTADGRGRYAGFVPGVVPGAVQEPGDLSWTAAYPLLARWLLLYYGALHVVRDHWSALKAWADGAARVAAAGGGDSLPDFWVWGDWCAVEARSTCTPGTGPQAAASNYILALKAMATS